MKRDRRGSKYGTLLFVIPLIVIFGIVAFTVYSDYTAPTTGTLSVITLVHPYHQAEVKEAEQVTVDGSAMTAPLNLTVAPGSETVVFQPLNGYSTPSPRTVVVEAGKTAYAVAVYVPIVRVVGVETNSFNVTSVKAVQGVTPVSFVNISNQTVTIESLAFGLRAIDAGLNFTYVYQSQGTSEYWNYLNRNITGVVTTEP